MKVTSERLPNAQVKLDVEVNPERVEESIDAAYKRLARKVKIPGFRPGKAPRPVVERHLGGREALLHEALDRLVPEVYDEVIEEQDIAAIDLPQLSITNLDPVSFTATIPIRPEVKLGDYKSIRVPREPVDVPEELVDAEIEQIRATQAIVEPVERPVQLGDVLRVNVALSVDGEEQFSRDDVEFALHEERVVIQPGFKEELLGMSKGESKDFTLPVSDDHPDESRRGKDQQFHVAVNEVKERRLPELDDDFAGAVGEGFDSLEELKQRIRDNLRVEREREEGSRYENAILDQLLERAEIEFPPVLVEREIDHQLRDHMGGSPGAFEQQLKRAGRTAEEVKEELRPHAEDRVKRSLVLSEVSTAEEVAVDDSEIDAEIDRMTEGAGESAERIRELFDSESGRATLRRSLTTRKTFDRLVEIAGSPAPEGIAEGPVAPKKARRRRKAKVTAAVGGPTEEDQIETKEME
ncbi:MAG: trigger factor [Dehalococcoidia bacterium]